MAMTVDGLVSGLVGFEAYYWLGDTGAMPAFPWYNRISFS